MENALFYTLSTIAQTLAAAIALLSALVLYRSQRISEDLRSSMFQVTQPYYLSADAQLWFEQERFADVLNHLKTAQALNADLLRAPEYAGRRARAESLISLQRQLQTWLKIALTVTVVVMAGAVAAIAAVPWIIRTSVGPGTTLVIAVIGFIACLAIYGVLAAKSVQ